MSTAASIAADSRRGRGIAAVAGCAFLWSTSGLLIKFVPWNPLAIAGMRSLFAGLVMLAWLRRPQLTWSRTQVGAAIFYAATMVSYVVANKLTTSANAILLQYTAPVYAALLAAPILGERAHWQDWVAIAVTLGGMALFFLDKLSAGGLWGNLIAVGSGVLFAVAMVLLRKQKQGSPLESIMLSQFITFAVSIPFLWRGMAGDPAVSPVLSWGAIAFLGIFQIGVSAILLAYGVRHVPAVQTFLISMIEPIFNPVWVFLLLGEVPGPRALLGGLAILAATTFRSVAPLVANRRARGGPA